MVTLRELYSVADFGLIGFCYGCSVLGTDGPGRSRHCHSCRTVFTALAFVSYSWQPAQCVLQCHRTRQEECKVIRVHVMRGAVVQFNASIVVAALLQHAGLDEGHDPG